MLAALHRPTDIDMVRCSPLARLRLYDFEGFTSAPNELLINHITKRGKAAAMLVVPAGCCSWLLMMTMSLILHLRFYAHQNG